MTFLLKDPDSTLDYSIDWGSRYLGQDALGDSSWEVSPVEPGGLAIAGTEFDLTTARVKAGGGVPGHVYTLVNKVVLVSGLNDRRSITLRVEKR